MQTLGLSTLQLAIICMAVGEFMYARVRTIAGLFWVASFFVFFPLSLVLSVAHFFLQGTTFGFLVALLFSALLLIGPGRILRRYRSAGSGNAQHG